MFRVQNKPRKASTSAVYQALYDRYSAESFTWQLNYAATNKHIIARKANWFGAKSIGRSVARIRPTSR